MISFGPTIRGAHTPEERIEIETVQMFWDLLIDVLRHIPRGKFLIVLFKLIGRGAADRA